MTIFVCFFFFQAEDGIRDLVRSRGLGDVYKRQAFDMKGSLSAMVAALTQSKTSKSVHLLVTADEELSLIHI